MKKYVAGFLAGALFTIGATSFADEIQSLVGKKIQGETAVSVNGKSIDKAVVVEGKSYAPVRSVAEAAGMKVQFGKEGISLSDESTKEIKPDPVTTEPIAETKETKKIIKETPLTLEQLNSAIKENKSQIEVLDASIKNQQILIDSGRDVESNKKILEFYENNKADREKNVEKFEKQKAELEKQ
ncbi:hypothetical protein [Paenibacillus ottowii]|uniref:Copper amine oxidase N-terminal domain-containing protein n=1 Tax=Paenibacillus ottowii TaxID=2315729 RepID=A0ABY3B1T0_9BACL|nr:hypothetical protein [Paenibacillus ottowii]TQR97305.1 hypothetical protein FKV70_18920 [Paenibacillus ottowii]